MDERLRSLEREGADDLRWVTEQFRLGRLAPERALAAAYLGHAGARAWLEDGARRRPRWKHAPLPPWTPEPRTLTERVEARLGGPGELAAHEAHRELLRGAAAQAALGRLELPRPGPGWEARTLEDGRRRVVVRGPTGGCLLLHWLACVAWYEGRTFIEDLAAVADLVARARVARLEPRHRLAARLELPATGHRRALAFDGNDRPVPIFIEMPDALFLVERYLTWAPDHPQTAHSLAVSPFKARAARALDELIAASGAPYGWLAKAEALEGLGAVDEAERTLDAGLARLPDHRDLREARAALLGRAGDPRAAAADWGHAATLAQGPAARADTLAAQGRALLDGGLPAEALAPLEAALAIRGDSTTLLLQARARRLSGDAGGARRAVAAALERAPSSPEVRAEAELLGLPVPWVPGVRSGEVPDEPGDHDPF